MINSANPETHKFTPPTKLPTTWSSLGVPFDLLRSLRGSLEQSFYPTYYQEEIYKTFMDNPNSIIHLIIDKDCDDLERMLGYLVPMLNLLRIKNERETTGFVPTKSMDLKKIVSQQALILSHAATQELASNANQLLNTKPLGVADVTYDSVGSLAKIQMNLPERSSRSLEVFMGSIEDFLGIMDSYPKGTTEGFNIGRLKAIVIDSFDMIYMSTPKKQLLALGKLLQRLKTVMPVLIITSSVTKKLSSFMDAVFDNDAIKVRRTLTVGKKENVREVSMSSSNQSMSFEREKSEKDKGEIVVVDERFLTIKKVLPGTLHLQSSNIDLTESKFVQIRAIESSLKLINEKLASFEVRMNSSGKRGDQDVCTFRDFEPKNTASFTNC